MQPKDTAIRKRTQIAQANKTMFIWIAVSSVLVGSALVISFVLVQKLIFNEKVLAEKQNTVSILKKNNEVVGSLEAEVRVLDTNTDLAAVKTDEEDSALQVILDALPSEANSLALGGSLQHKLLRGIDGLTVESLQVSPVEGVETDGSINPTAQKAINFQFVVSGSQTALNQVLTNLERSIRAIEVLSLRVESQGGNQLMTVRARAFYEPAKTADLIDKVVRP